MFFHVSVLRLFVLTVVLAVGQAFADPREYSEDIERDFVLRRNGQLQITNTRGNISIRGWALDKIRVRAKRRATAETLEDAKKLFSALDFRFHDNGGSLELLAEYGRGLEIEDRLKERSRPKTSMEMEVFAPAHLKLRVWATRGKVTLTNWSSDVEIRTSEGAIYAENLRSDAISLLCPACVMEIKNTHGNLRCMGGTGTISLSQARGTSIYAETSAGLLSVSGVEGEQLFVTKTGDIRATGLKGHIEFHTQHGNVEVLDGDGFLSGHTETGDVTARMKRWAFSDKALIETGTGRIELTLPSGFAGDLDVWSVFGKAEVAFPLSKNTVRKVYGPEPANHLVGSVGRGGDLLKLASEKGDVRVLRGTF